MDTPRILAIDDVHLAAAQEAVDELAAFYTGLVGLNRVDSGTEEGRVMFRGYPHSGPKLVVNLGGQHDTGRLRRQVLIQVSSVTDCADQMAERRTPFVWSHGWTFYDQRLTAMDPAGNRVGLVTYHRL